MREPDRGREDLGGHRRGRRLAVRRRDRAPTRREPRAEPVDRPWIELPEQLSRHRRPAAGPARRESPAAARASRISAERGTRSAHRGDATARIPRSRELGRALPLPGDEGGRLAHVRSACLCGGGPTSGDADLEWHAARARARKGERKVRMTGKRAEQRLERAVGHWKPRRRDSFECALGQGRPRLRHRTRGDAGDQRPPGSELGRKQRERQGNNTYVSPVLQKLADGRGNPKEPVIITADPSLDTSARSGQVPNRPCRRQRRQEPRAGERNLGQSPPQEDRGPPEDPGTDDHA